ncbi:MAG: alpha/beta-type small acid-soluble spore protein [Turicibacter sp.]|jgi:hypothetical protein|nr:alpha/beta-type small acid-soluble spore protein [Turicibacter sp.]MEE1237845.1 alpha/beta-type small acid-soluble spore protein [Turicibacter sp.]
MPSQSNNSNSNKLLVPGAQNAIDQMKYEIASEQGVQLGADATARQNGSVGGEITKRLVRQAQQQMSGSQNQQ